MSFLERFLEASTGSPPDRQLKRRRRFWLGCGLAAAVQSRFVLRVVVLHAVLPAAEGNAHPFVCQRPYGRMVRFVFVVALRAVIGLCPVTVENGLAGPLMERLPQKFRAAPAPMHPALAYKWMHAVLPAAEGNVHPFVCQRPYGRMVRFVFVVALRAVIGLCPVTVENGLAGPLMERLPQKFRAAPAPMHPVLLAAGFGHRGDP